MVLARRSELCGLQRTAKRVFASPAAGGWGWMSVWLGIGVSASLSLGALLGVKDQTVAPSVIAGHVAFIFVGFFLAIYLGLTSRRARGLQGTAEDEFLAELDQLDQRSPSTLAD